MTSASWYPRAFLPNRDGSVVWLRLVDGTVTKTQVRRGPDGFHRLDGVSITDVEGWKPLGAIHEPPRPMDEGENAV